jgi:DNA-binding Xre family transcriptional regulator
MQTMPLQWKLEDLLERHKVSAYRLAKESGVGLTTIYRIKNNRTNTVQGQVLEAILQALLVLTGKRYGVGDLLEWQPEADK